ncbi:MAG TPA: hypothetical protein PLJ60_19105 [Chryseolinea sp.]|nr:hypothetical protein [Chryseolinea sp.]
MKKALRINALFSGISGSVLILFQSRIAHLFEIERSTVFWIIGVALIFFASTIFYEVERQNKFRILDHYSRHVVGNGEHLPAGC